MPPPAFGTYVETLNKLSAYQRLRGLIPFEPPDRDQSEVLLLLEKRSIRVLVGERMPVFGVETTGPLNAPATVQEFMGSAHLFVSLAHEAIERGALREVAGMRLTLQQLTLLMWIERNDRWRVGNVAGIFHVSTAAASKMVDRLVRHKLLRRHRATADRRVAELSLTERSRRLLAAYRAARNRRLAKVLPWIAPAELENAVETLDHSSARLFEELADGQRLCLRCGLYPRDHCRLRELVGENCFYQRPEKHTPDKGKRHHGRRRSYC